MLPSGLTAGSQPDPMTAGVPPSAGMDLMVPVQPDPVAKYTVPLEATDTWSPVTPDATSVFRTAPVAGSSWTSAPALVTATIPGSVPDGEVAGEDVDPPWGAPDDPAPLAPDPAGALEEADEPPDPWHADKAGTTAMVAATRPAESRRRREKARDEERTLMARHDRARGPRWGAIPDGSAFSG